jgi:Adenylate and Guanylate cyclase catalytic domain
MSNVIGEHRGTLDKYIGDAIMAFWGAPVTEPGHAAQAVSAAMAMQERLGPLNATFKARGWPELSIGVGINTGPMSVGDMGSKLRKAYRAQDWDQADVALFNLRRLHLDAPLYVLYAERIARHRTAPPEPSWDGVTSFEEK